MSMSHFSKQETNAEGSRREQLAAYFLSVPPPEQQSAQQQAVYYARLRELGQLEMDEILENGGSRPLLWGNPVPLMQNLLTAAQRLAAGLGQPLFVFPAKETAIDFCAMLHPRILSMSLLGLLREGCRAAPHHPLWVRMQEQEHCLTVAVTADAPFTARDTLRLIQESARLHKGSLALCENSAAFSIGRTETVPSGARPYVSPTAEELLRDSLSPVWTGFFAWIYSPASSGTESASASPETSAAETSEAASGSDDRGEP